MKSCGYAFGLLTALVGVLLAACGPAAPSDDQSSARNAAASNAAAPTSASDQTEVNDSVAPSAIETDADGSSAPQAEVSDPIELIEALTDPSLSAREGCEGTPPVVWAMADYYAGHTGTTATEMRVELARTCGFADEHFDGQTAASLGLSEAEFADFVTAWEALHG